jgi:hypothetical protein
MLSFGKDVGAAGGKGAEEGPVLMLNGVEAAGAGDAAESIGVIA